MQWRAWGSSRGPWGVASGDRGRQPGGALKPGGGAEWVNIFRKRSSVELNRHFGLKLRLKNLRWILVGVGLKKVLRFVWHWNYKFWSHGPRRGGLRIVDKIRGGGEGSFNAYESEASQKNLARYARIHSLQINISNCLIIGLDFTSRTGAWSLGVRTLLRPSEWSWSACEKNFRCPLDILFAPPRNKT